jgi:hypothetical protein
MARKVWPRVLASLLLVLFSLGSVSAAELPKERKRPSFAIRLLETVESFLPQVLLKSRDGMDPDGTPAPVFLKSRGTMDPNGTPAPSSSQAAGAESDARDGMDPNG